MQGERVRIISLSDLASSFATRRRGAEAYDRLLPFLKDGPVVLDLDGVGVMPASFLDALILRLIESGHAGDVSFRTTSARAKEKLRRLSGLRDVSLFLHQQLGAPEKLEPRLPAPSAAQGAPDSPDDFEKAPLR